MIIKSSTSVPKPRYRWFSFFTLAICCLILWPDSVQAGSMQSFWEANVPTHNNKPFNENDLNPDRTGWYGPGSRKMKSISQMGYRDKLSVEDASTDRDTAKDHVPWTGNGWFDWLNKWFSNLPTGAPAVNNGPSTMFWAILLTVGALILAILVAVFVRKFVGRGSVRKEAVANIRKRKPKLSDLPFQLEKVELTEDSLWNLVLKHRDKGDYSKAIIFLFSYLLLNLDRKNLLVLKAGKTNRTYLAELNKSFDGRNLFASMMLCFEDAFFGNKSTKQTEIDSFISQCQPLRSGSAKKSFGGR